MKNFVVALIIFALTVLLITANSIFISHIKDELLASVSGIPFTSETTILFRSDDILSIKEGNSQLLQTWNKYKNYISLVSLYDYVYDIQSALDQMIELYNNGLNSEYAAQRRLLVSAIKRLGESEEFSLVSIF